MSERSPLAFVSSWMIAWRCCILWASQAYAADADPVGKRILIKPSISRDYQAQYVVKSTGRYTRNPTGTPSVSSFTEDMTLTEKVQGTQPEEDEVMVGISYKYSSKSKDEEGGAKGEGHQEGNLLMLHLSKTGEVSELFSGTYLVGNYGLGILTSFVLLRSSMRYPKEGVAVGETWESHFPLKVTYGFGGETMLNAEARHKVEKEVQQGTKKLLEIKSTVCIVQPQTFKHAMQTKMVVDGKPEPYKWATTIDKYSLKADVTWLIDLEGQVVNAEGAVKGEVSSDNREKWGKKPEIHTKEILEGTYTFQAARQ